MKFVCLAIWRISNEESGNILESKNFLPVKAIFEYKFTILNNFD